MRPSQLDFQRPAPTIPVLSWLLLATGLVVAGLALARYQDTRAALTEQQQRADRAEPRAARRIAAPVATVGPEAVLARRDWNGLLDRLETSLADDVSLLALDLDGRKGQAELRGVCADSAELFAYLERLRSQAGLTSAALQQHELRDDDPARPLSFLIRAQWDSPT